MSGSQELRKRKLNPQRSEENEKQHDPHSVKRSRLSSSSSSSSSILSGMLYFSNRPALTVQHADFVCLNNVRAQCLIQDDQTLRIEWTTSNAGLQRNNAMFGMVNEITHRKLELDHIQVQLKQALAACELARRCT
jgi:hypothetical protein